MRNRILSLFFLLFLTSWTCSQEEKYIPVNNEDDDVDIAEYQSIGLTSGASGSFTEDNNVLSLELDGANSIYGVCLPKVLEGHFIAEAKSDKKLNYGLAIVHEKNGKPDYNNFTSVSVCNENGTPVIRVIDRQKGQDNVLDRTGKISENDYGFRYSVPLTGEAFSVPFTKATGRVRILRNDLSGFFHFYIGVGKTINGQFAEDWVELAQSKDWAHESQKYFICPIVRNTDNKSVEIVFDDIRFENFSPADISDAGTGFKVEKRDYTWAGFPGEATVVSFDSEYCKFAGEDRKFVFWSEMNYIPAWHMDNEMLFSYEFAETWSHIAKGCFEPMSDRLLAFNKVKILEDNRVRKVVKFEYPLINPDYTGPYKNGAYPVVDEYYTLYPDGIGVRRIDYIQNEEGRGNYIYHELAEPLVIAGSQSTPKDHFNSPALTISNLASNSYSLYPAKPFDEVNNNVKNWSEQIYNVHFANAPDAFCVFSFSPDRPEVSPLPIENDLTWHDVKYQMSHWPVDKQPYLNARHGDYDKSMADWPSQVSHSSLIGVEAKGDVSWTTAFKTNENGQKYRTYLMLFGLADPNNSDEVSAITRTWLLPGNIESLDNLIIEEDKTGYAKREIVLTRENSGACSFVLKPSGALKNPVFRVDNWSSSSDPQIFLNDNLLKPEIDYIAEVINSSLIIWFNKSFSNGETQEIQVKE